MSLKVLGKLWVPEPGQTMAGEITLADKQAEKAFGYEHTDVYQCVTEKGQKFIVPVSMVALEVLDL